MTTDGAVTQSGDIGARDVRTVLAYAKGEAEHLFNGSCHDAREGVTSYDPRCRVCQAALRLSASLEGAPSA